MKIRKSKEHNPFVIINNEEFDESTDILFNSIHIRITNTEKLYPKYLFYVLEYMQSKKEGKLGKKDILEIRKSIIKQL